MKANTIFPPRRILALLMAAVLAGGMLAGCGSAPADAPVGGIGTQGSEAPGTQPAETQPTESQAAAETVLCLTQIIGSYDGVTYIYDVTYEDDGIHVTPQTLADSYVSVYNADGNVLYELRYNSEGVNNYRSDYTYNSAGQQTEWLQFDIDDNCKASRRIHIYNDQGQLIQEVYENRVSVSSTYEYSYDANGFLSSRITYNSEGVMSGRYEYVCDAQGRIQTCTAYTLDYKDDMRDWGIFTYSYDAEGRLLSKVWEQTYTGHYASLMSEYYTYDAAGNVTYWEEGSHTANTYSYDAAGYLTGAADTLTGGTTTFVYSEIPLRTDLAEMAAAWSMNGVKNAFTPDPN